MQRIDSGSCSVVGAAVPPSSNSRNCCAACFLSGGRSRGLQARIEDGAVGTVPFHGQRPGLLLLGECRQCVSDDQRAMADRDGGSVDERQPVLGRKLDRRKSGHRQRIAGWQSLAPILGLAFADQHAAKRRHQHEVAGADRAERRHDRMDAGVQRGDQRGDDAWRNAGAADRQHGCARQHRRPDDIHRQRIADRAAAPLQQLALEGARIAADRRTEIGAEAGVQSVDGLAGCGGTVEHARAPCADALHHGRRDLDLASFAGDRRDVLDTECPRR